MNNSNILSMIDVLNRKVKELSQKQDKDNLKLEDAINNISIKNVSFNEETKTLNIIS